MEAIYVRLAEFDNGDWPEEHTNLEHRTFARHEEFDDAALYSLFPTLLSSQDHLRPDATATLYDLVRRQEVDLHYEN